MGNKTDAVLSPLLLYQHIAATVIAGGDVGAEEAIVGNVVYGDDGVIVIGVHFADMNRHGLGVRKALDLLVELVGLEAHLRRAVENIFRPLGTVADLCIVIFFIEIRIWLELQIRRVGIPFFDALHRLRHIAVNFLGVGIACEAFLAIAVISGDGD